MTVIENLESEFDVYESYAELTGFERIRPRRDGQMPVGRDRAKHRAYRRTNQHRQFHPRTVSTASSL
jgi:hypothetical protein